MRRIVLLAAAVSILAVPTACRAGADIYVFADERGVVHLTDVPDHSRYRPLDPVRPAFANANAGEAARRALSAAPQRQRAYDEVVEKAARQFNVDAALVHAVIQAESGYNPKAVSRSGACGLMQLMADTAKRYGVADVFDPAENVRAGTQYLGELLSLFDNDLQLALAAYNAGENAVLRYARTVPPYPETQAYVPKVVQLYGEFAQHPPRR